jgi:hypothetical protein
MSVSLMLSRYSHQRPDRVSLAYGDHDAFVRQDGWCHRPFQNGRTRAGIFRVDERRLAWFQSGITRVCAS